MTDQFPTYNLKAVLKETGLKADVLRAWERRYELPKPVRTSGGHRIYSQVDIETVKWLRARQVEGLSISRAVDLWKETVKKGLDPLQAISPAAAARAPARHFTADASLDLLRQEWLDAVLAFDGAAADRVISVAFGIYPVEMVCTEILQVNLSRIGDDWVQEKVTVQQEHFASSVAARRLEILISAAPSPTRRQTILIGCPSGEQHTFPVLLLGLLLLRRGLHVVNLGADIPVEQFDSTVASVHPDIIILAAQMLPAAGALQQTAQALKGSGIPLAYGGLIFNRIPELRRRIPGHFIAETLDEAVFQVERLLVDPPAAVDTPEIIPSMQELAELFRQRRPQIEIAVFEKLKKDGHETEFTTNANFFFGNSLSAALELGDPAFLADELGWLRGLLKGRRIIPARLTPYLAAYSSAVRSVIGQAGAPITSWIDSITNDHNLTPAEEQDS